MKAMILAAGKGERLRPLTLKTPKPLVKVNGKPLIVHHIERFARAGIDEIIINHSWLGRQLPDTLGNGENWGVNIIYSPEEKPMGTGGGIQNTLTSLGEEPFLLVSADIFTNFPFERLVQKKLPDTLAGHIVLIDNPPHHRQGDYCLENNLVKPPDHDLKTLTYASIALLSPQMFSTSAPCPFSIAFVFNQAINQNLLTGERFNGYHCNVDTFARLQKAQEASKSGMTD